MNPTDPVPAGASRPRSSSLVAAGALRWVAAGLLVVVAGCGAPATAAGDAAALRDAASARSAPADTGVAATVPAPATGVRADAGDDNAALDAAFAAALACVDDFDVTADLVHDGIGNVSIDVRADSEAGIDAANEAINTCLEREFQPTVDRYHAANPLRPADRAFAERSFLRCLHDRGYEVGDVDAAYDDERIVDDDHDGCARQASARVARKVRARAAASPGQATPGARRS